MIKTISFIYRMACLFWLFISLVLLWSFVIIFLSINIHRFIEECNYRRFLLMISLISVLILFILVLNLVDILFIICIKFWRFYLWSVTMAMSSANRKISILLPCILTTSPGSVLLLCWWFLVNKNFKNMMMAGIPVLLLFKI